MLLAFCSVLRGADTNAPTSTPAPAAVTHITDAQDRMGTGKLKSTADAKSKANALYAEAMLLPEDLADDGQTELALFRQIVVLDPTFTEAQIKLANLYLQSGQTDQALTQLQSLAASHPDSIPIEVALGYTYHLRGQNDDAVRLCTRVLTHDPTQTLAMRVLLDVASDQDDLAGAVLHIEDILKRSANVPASVWMSFAQLYLEIARGERFPPGYDVILRTRLPILEAAAAILPPDVQTLTLLSDSYRDLGRKAEALSTLRRAAELQPSDFSLALHCAALEKDLGQTAGEIKDYEKAYTLNPALPGLRETLGSLYVENDRFADAIPLLIGALADAPQDPGLQLDLALAYQGAHQPDKAQSYFLQVFSSATCPPEIYLQLAIFQMDHKDLKPAAATLAAAQTHFPDFAKVRFYEAIQHRYEKNYPAAIDCLAQVRTLAVGAEAGALDPFYYLECAMTLNLAGQKPQLETVLQEGLAKFPDNPDLMNELAYFWADEGQHLPEALALSRRATTLAPDDGAILDTYGWVFFQLGQAKDALPYLQRAAIMTNNDAVVLQHVGDACAKLGLRHEAFAAWTHALEKDPKNPDLVNRINAAEAQAKNAQLRSAPRP